MSDKRIAHTAKFSSHQFELLEPLHEDTHLVFQGSGELQAITKKVNNDEQKFIYTITPLIVEIAEADTELELHKKKVKRHSSASMTMSQELRMVIENLWQAEGSQGDKEDFYKSYMNRLITRVRAEIEMERGY